ncbi:MAG TPA: high-potential iron-sulfur protein [Burkholderiaceae bacterium]
MNINRRTFIIHSLVGSAALATAGVNSAQTAKLAESDPQAAALGYKENATKVDKAKYPSYAAGQSCASCQLYQGPATGAGKCAIFQGKLVASTGWCGAYAKKA